MPVATAAPTRSASGSIASPESCSAMRAAATMRCAKRSILRIFLRSMYSCGSKSFTSQANFTSNSDGSNCVIGPAPLRPATRFSQVVSTSFPRGVIMPIPVITTLRRPFELMLASSHAEAAVDEQHLARDERGLVGAQEAYRPGHVLRLAEAAE